ncbi:MAG TPA: hypothetical protein VGW38_29090, partial [Chloroflexota bacterium]|nr:hypothetical protein [Chloroflexota bacterium]
VVQGLLVHPPPALLPHAVAAPVGWRLDVFPWTAAMPDLFEQLYGKPIETHLPYVLSPLHADEEATSSPLDAWLEAVKRQYQTSLHHVLEQWCRSNRLRMRAVDARVLPHVPYSVLGERKRALAPGTLIDIETGAMGTLPPPAHVAAAPSPAVSRNKAEWVAVPILTDTWEWQPASLNWLALGEWSQWEASADGDTFHFRGSFVAEFVPEVIYALFEAGAVQSLSINGITVPLEAARRPEPHEIELADESYRIVPLAPEAIRMSGINVVEATATIAPRILLDGGCTAGPLALAGNFAVFPFAAQDVLPSAPAVQEEAWRLVRPPGLVSAGNWGAIGYPRLSGHARYVQTFPFRAIGDGMRAQLIVDVQGALGEVRINGRSATRLSDTPAVFDLTEVLRTGLNRIEIDCRSGLAARLSGGTPGGLLAVRLEVDRSPQVILDTMRQESERNW